VSKVIAAGLRVGYLVAPRYAIQNILDSLRATVLSLPLITVEILSFWLESGVADQIIKRRAEELRARQEMAQNLLSEYMQNINPISYHLWLKLPRDWISMQFALEAHRQGVAIAPSEIFTVDKKTYSNAVRVSIATAENREILRTGLEILSNILSETPTNRSITV